MAWKCHDRNCDYCLTPLGEKIICDMMMGGHYDSTECWESGRKLIVQHCKHVIVIREDER